MSAFGFRILQKYGIGVHRWPYETRWFFPPRYIGFLYREIDFGRFSIFVGKRTWAQRL